jgi:hypothetical protein
MRVGTAAASALGALAALALLFGWVFHPAPPAGPPLPVPVFTSPTAGSDPLETRPVRRDTLLPRDCAQALSGPVDVAALLGAPVGSFSVQTVVGVPSPSVGLLERLTCSYQRAGERAPALVFWLNAFREPDAATRQQERNVTAERADTRASRPVLVGSATGTLLTQPTRYLLIVSLDRYLVTVSLARGVVRAEDVEAVTVDLVRRVWPNIAPGHTALRVTR